MNKDKKGAAAAGPQPPPPPATQQPGQPQANPNIPKMATPMEEATIVKKTVLPVDELMPTLRPPAGSISGGSMDGGDSDTEEHLQV
jgi:hypothetical protein